MSFEEKIRVAFGKRGEVWLVELPKQLEKIACLHELTGLTPFSNLSYNYVARATMKGKSVVLKVGIPGTDFTNEAVAMQVFGTFGVPQLLFENTDSGYYIMENISPGYTLNVRFPDTRTSVRLFVEQWRRLHDTQVPTTDLNQLPQIERWFESLETHYDAIPEDWRLEAKRAKQRIHELQQTTILHGDLHHENILWDDLRGFVIIDPKGVVGHRYYDCVQFLFNKNKNLVEFKLKVELLIDEHGFEENLLVDAIKALGTVYYAWMVEDRDPVVGERVEMLDWIMSK